MNVMLIAHTPNPDGIAGLAASMCSRGSNIMKSLDSAMEKQHLSVTEHANFTFIILGVSRALLAQLTRHRIASFSVQSQRYVSECQFEYVIPPEIKALGEDEEAMFMAQMSMMQDWYSEWHRKLLAAGRNQQQANEDARFVLPNAAATRLMVTMNARELMHFFELRCCSCAQWEIREMAWKMLKECKKAAPVMFADAGPACMHGLCPEGTRSCGMKWKEEMEREENPDAV